MNKHGDRGGSAGMKLRQDIGVGDAVEVAAVERPVVATPIREYSDDDPPPAIPPMTETWLPATVVFANRSEIGIAFSDGERLAIPRFSNKWRPA